MLPEQLEPTVSLSCVHATEVLRSPALAEHRMTAGTRMRILQMKRLTPCRLSGGHTIHTPQRSSTLLRCIMTVAVRSVRERSRHTASLTKSETSALLTSPVAHHATCAPVLQQEQDSVL